MIGPWGNDFSVKWCHGDRKDDVVRFLRAADLAIDDVRVVLGESSEQGVADDEAQVRLTHDTKHGRPVELDLGEESHGTQKMFALAAPWRDSLDNGHIMVCDELHGFLHPALVRFLVEQFHDPELNAKGAQLIFTTHETSILSQDILRRDQVWFCERNSRQETNLFPLTDFRPRQGAENLERSYLGGRYGALPYVRPARIRSNVRGMARRRPEKRFARRGPTREPYDRVLIVCEGERTEPLYLGELADHYRLSTANFKVVGRGADPKTVVREAKEQLRNENSLGENFDRVYCVFDRDEHARFLEACNEARASGLMLARSWPCFEFWLRRNCSPDLGSRMTNS